MTAKSSRVSTRSSLKRVSDTIANDDLQRRAEQLEELLREPDLKSREQPTFVARRLAAVAAEHRFRQVRTRSASRPIRIRWSHACTWIDAEDDIAFARVEDIADPFGGDRIDREERRRRGQGPYAFTTLRGHLVEDHMQHRHAFDGNSGGAEQLVGGLIGWFRLGFHG